MLYGQTGNTLKNPIVVNIRYNVSDTYEANTINFTNEYGGRPTNDVFYKFTLSKRTVMEITHCGSVISDTYMYLLNSEGSYITYNDDYNGEGKCPVVAHSYIKEELEAGTYYIVSKGFNQNGIIRTTFKAISINGDTFNDPINIGSFSDDFAYSDTQNSAHFTNAYTVRAPNDIFYKFTLSKKMQVVMTHCGSVISTYMHLLDASGKSLAVNDDYSGDGCCSSPTNSYIKRELGPGTYYIVSEGYNISGMITTNVNGYSSSQFNYPDIPDAHSSDKDPVVTVRGNLNVSTTGSAQYAVPIETPLGVGGMQPSLSIVYDSQSQNGMVGWGCSLTGLSAITRTPKSLYYDGSSKGLTFQTGDAYMLDGKRMVLSSGNDLQEGAVYYLEDDPLTKIIAHGAYNNTTANTWFEVNHSNGLKYYFGNTSSGRQTYSVGNSPRIYSWYLDYVEDSMGNYMNYSYFTLFTAMYPTSITYGKNKNNSNSLTHTVTFQYESRPDMIPFVIEGDKGLMYFRLKDISTKTGDQLYRKYELNYSITSDAENKISRLTTITAKNSQGESLKPVKFEWTFTPSFYSYPSTPMVNAPSTYPSMSFTDQQFTAADFNGDGLTDILGIAPVKIPTGPNSWTYDTYAYVYYASVDDYGNTKFVTGKNYSLGASFQMGDWKEHRGSSSAIDFDGDGINEFIVPHASINSQWKQIGFYIYSNTLNGVFGYNLQRSSEMVVYATGDINNDGKGDIVFIEKGHSNNRYPGEIVGLNYGTTLYRAAFNLYLPSKPEKMFISDYNGDGLDDLMILYSGGYTIFWNQGYGINTSTFTDSKKTSGSNFGAGYWTMIRTGDFNGDGLMDFIINDTNDSNWYFAINNGNGTFAKSLACSIYAYDQSSTSADDDKFECFVFDFNKDGYDDVVINKTMYAGGTATRTYTYWMRSTGSSLTNVSTATSLKPDDGMSHRYLAGDFNGDGNIELMNYGYNCFSSKDANVNPSWRIYTWGSGNNTDRGKVNKITEGNGSDIRIGYASMGNDKFYTKGSGSSYPVIDIRIPLHAVKYVSVDNGSAGSIYTTFEYKGLKAHLQGKGLLGMTTHISNNVSLGVVTETGVKTWNNTFYIPSATYTKTTMDGKTEETNITLSILDKGKKKYVAYPTTQTEKDMDGNTVTTTYKFNTTYGYPEEEKADFGDKMYKTMQYSNYILAGNTYKPQLITLTQKHSDDASVYTVKTAITYDTSKGYQKQVIKNQGSSLPLTTDYTYDAFGNLLTSKESGSGITPLTKVNTYDASKRYVTKVSTTPETSTISFTYDNWGNILTENDETNRANILTTSYTYDNWGNQTKLVSPDGRITTFKKGWNKHMSKRYFLLTEATGQPWVKTWYDARGREVLIETIGPKSISIQKNMTYNLKGQLITEQVQTGSVNVTEEFTYDARGRLASTKSSNGQNITYAYDNRKVTTTNNGKAYTKTIDAWGGVKSVTDPVSSIAYTYKSLGKPQSISTGGATASITYDAIGNQTAISDQNTGTSTFTYDAAGRLIKQIDGKVKTTVNAYDALGRLSSTTIDGIATTYTYGTSGNDLLLLTKLQTGNNYTAYTYDKYGRMATEKRQVDGTGLLEFSYAYNAQGRLSSTTHPGSLQVSNQYDAYGNLIKVLAGTQPVWELTGETGTVSSVQLGGTLTATRTRNTYGLLTNLKTAKGTTSLHNMNFTFDGTTGNLMSRTGMVPQTESFSYDNVDRLTSVKHGTSAVMNMDYKPNGNINSKTGLGQYSYGTQPHAITRVENTGKLISTENQKINYTAFNKISGISEKVGADNFELNFTYGPTQQRWKTILKKNGNIARTTVYAGNYETITENGQTKQLYYIGGGDGIAAIYVKQSGQADKIYYPYFDHQGSIVKLTDANGSEVFKASYDAWGNRTVSNNAFAFHRGYTGHEHLNEFKLINMNGRMYDPIVGRFLSADPIVQMMDFSQNYNRYSYCLNNPLRYTDLSGYAFGIDDFIIIAAFAYIGGMQANFAYSAEHNTNPFNPGNWNWKSAHTYIGIGSGAIAGAGFAGITIPNTQVSGMISNGLLQGGVQVTLNGIGNLTDKRSFFDNWYYPFAMGFASGAYAGYGLAKQKGVNYWWGDEVKYNRTQWSFINADKPDYVIDMSINNVGSKSANDCVPTTFAEIENRTGGSRTYSDFVTSTGHVVGEGNYESINSYRTRMRNTFTGYQQLQGTDAANVFDPTYMENASNTSDVISFHLRDGSGAAHADNVRRLEVFTRDPAKNRLIFRHTKFNLQQRDGWSNVLSIFRIGR